MESLKKVISLNQAAKISGYTQDYLGSLIRSGEIKGIKKGRAWFTTEREVKGYLLKKKILHKKQAVKSFFSRNFNNKFTHNIARSILVITIIMFVAIPSLGFYLSFAPNSFVPSEHTESVKVNKIVAQEKIPTSLLAASALDSLTSVSSGLADGWITFTDGILNNIISSANGTADFVASVGDGAKFVGNGIANGIVSTWNSFKLAVGNTVEFIASIFNPTHKTNLAVTTTKKTINISVVDNSLPTPTTPVVVETPTPTPTPTNNNTTKTIIQKITEKPTTTIINQFDPTLLSRIQGIELAILNNTNHNSLQTNTTYDSVGRNINSAVKSITESGTLNDSTLNSPAINNATINSFTSTGSSVFTHIPTFPHAFDPSWPSDISNVSDSSLYINPTSSVADGNLLGLAVGGVAKFIVDAEGDVYGNNLILTGSTTTGATTVNDSLSVLGTFSQTGANTFGTGTGAVSLNGATSVTGTNTFNVGIGTATFNGDVTSVGNTTLATGITTTNTFGSGASSINTIGSVTTPGALTFHGATTLDNTFSQTGAYTFGTGTGLISLNGPVAVTGANTFTTGTGNVEFKNVSTNISSLSPVIDLTSATTLSINTVNNRPVTFGTGLVTIPNLSITNSQGNNGTMSITSNATTQTILSITGASLTSGTGITENITANADSGQITKGHAIAITDATLGAGGYTALSISATGAGVGLGNKYLLDMNPGANKEVVFDSAGAFRPTSTVATNTNTIGSSDYYWKNGYFDQITANNIAGVVVGGATSSTSWTIGSTQVADVNESLIFYRNNLGAGNASLQWNFGAGDLRHFSVNYPFNATYTVSDTSITTDMNLYSGSLVNSTTGGTQKLLSLTNTGTGTTENGIYVNNTGTAATTAIEIAGTWTNGLITNNNSINAGSGAITGGAGNFSTIGATTQGTGAFTTIYTDHLAETTAAHGVVLDNTLALGTNNLTMTGSIADTTNRLTKLWATDIDSYNGINGLFLSQDTDYNVKIGQDAGDSLSVGAQYNTFLGYEVGRYISGGFLANTNSSYSVFIGSAVKALTSNDQNEIVIGYDATGNGSNTATIGNSSLLRTYLTGVNLKAGTATAGTAPLKFTSGTLLGTTEAGAIEFLTDAYYGTITTGAGTAGARKTFAFLESPVFTGTFGTGTGAVSLNGATTANTFSSSGATITGGTINNSTIGITTPVAGNFSTIGVTTQGSGAFTTLTTSSTINSQTISATANFTGSVAIAGVVTGATSYNGLVITANTGDITTGTWNGTTIADGKIASALTGKTYNGLTITNNGANTLNIAGGKSLIVNNSLTLAGTDSTTMTFPTTSATIARTDVGQTFTGTQTFSSTIVGSINGNANTATTLATSRNIWGQSFNGSTDVTGNLTSVGNITGSSAVNISAGGSNQNVTLTPSGNGYTILNGNVGIGTTTPNEKLDVSGKIALDGTTIAYRPTTMTGTLVLGDGGTNLTHNTSVDGYYNTFVGLGVGTANTTGYENTAIGFNSMNASTVSDQNTAIGGQSMYSMSTGHANTAVGYKSLWTSSGGVNNTAIGVYSQYLTTTASYNTSLGTHSMNNNTTGYSNLAVGESSLYSNVSGAGNTAIGPSALYYSLGSGNVALGVQAGYRETGSNSLYIDNQDRGSLADGKTKSLVYGIFDADPANQLFRVNGKIESTIATGTSPLTITSTTLNTNLNADLLDGQHGSDYAQSSVYPTTGLTTGYVPYFNSYLRNSGLYFDGQYFGFGTTSVGEKIEVNGAIKSTGDLMSWKASSGSMGYGGGALNFYSTGADTSTIGKIKFYTAASDGSGVTTPMTIDNNGNVGIGTTAPLAKLEIDDVARSLIKWSYGGSGIGYMGNSNVLFSGMSATDLGILATTKLQLGAGSTLGMTILNGGNVGIGTTTPGALLHVFSSTNTTGEDAPFTIGDNTTGKMRLVAGVNDANNYAFIGAVESGSAYRNLVLQPIDGNVGIGTTAPRSGLEISNAAAPQLIIYNPTAYAVGTKSELDFYHSATTPYVGTSHPYGGIGTVITGNITGDMYFWTRNGAADESEKMRIQSNGNVGIGTVAPDYKLDIKGDANNDGVINIASGNGVLGKGGELRFASTFGSLSGVGDVNSRQSGRITVNGDGSNLAWNSFNMHFLLNTATSETPTWTDRMTILNNGNVGIGTTAPMATTNIHVSTAGMNGPTTSGSAAFEGFRIDHGDGGTTLDMGIQANSNPTYSWIQSRVSGDYTANSVLSLNPNGGNVGIGTTNPWSLLSVSATSGYPAIDVGLNGTHKGGMNYDITNDVLQIQTTGNLYPIDFLSGKVRIQSNGNVGIGTTGPNAKLDVNGKIASYVDGVNQIYFVGGGGPNQPTYPTRVEMGNSAWHGYMSLYDSGSTKTIQLIASGDSYINGGNVGIGTTSPGSKLDISGLAATGADLRLREGTNNQSEYIGLKAPDAITTSVTYTLPEMGTANYCLALPASGSALVWVSCAGTGMADPMTTAGDLIYRNAANVTTRLGPGTNGQILVATTSGATVVPVWTTPATGLTIGGSDSPAGQIQYRSSGNFVANANFYLDSTTSGLIATGSYAGVKATQFSNSNSGTASATELDLGNNTSADQFYLRQNSTTFPLAAAYVYVWNKAASPMIFATSDTERMRIAADGSLVVIGSITGAGGAFTTLTSSGATTLGTGASLTNTFGSGASSINTIGSATTPGALTLHGATTLDNTFSQTGANTFSTGTGAVSLNGDTTIATGKNFSQVGTGTFSTGTGAISLNGATTVTGTNTFSTGTGAISLNGATTVTGANTFGTGTGAVSLNGATTLISTFAQTGANTFSTGTGAVSLNGATSVTGTNTFNVGTGLTTLGGNLAVTGTINKITLTAPATGSTLTIVDGKTLTVNKIMSLTSADDTGVYTFPTGTKTLVATDISSLSSLATVGTITSGGLGAGAVIGGATISGATMTLGSDAGYDMYYRDATGVLKKLTNGTTGQALISTTGSAPSWSSTPTFSGMTLTTNPVTDPTDVYLCISTLGVVHQGSTCTASAERFKDNITPLAHGLDWLNQFTPSTYNWKYNGSSGMSLIADNVASIDPQLAIYQDGQVYSLNDRAIQAVMVKAIQELNLKVSDLSSLDTTRATSLGYLMKGFLENVGNNVSDLYAVVIHSDKVETKMLCVSDETGAKTCIDKTQLDNLMAGVAGVPVPVLPSVESVPIGTAPEPAISAAGSPVPEVVGSVEPVAPAPEQSATGSPVVDPIIVPVVEPTPESAQ